MKKRKLHIILKNSRGSGTKERRDHLKAICWVIVPVIASVLLALDALGIYSFNTERLIVLGIGLLTVLLPFFSEVAWKDFRIRRDKSKP